MIVPVPVVRSAHAGITRGDHKTIRAWGTATVTARSTRPPMISLAATDRSGATYPSTSISNDRPIHRARAWACSTPATPLSSTSPADEPDTSWLGRLPAFVC